MEVGARRLTQSPELGHVACMGHDHFREVLFRTAGVVEIGAVLTFTNPPYRHPREAPKIKGGSEKMLTNTY